ncbi:MAG: molybdopterin-guanine dinucleotide biosynthesis protein B [Dehalococcoidales bacterium]|nr:molybdopterin-guanine dinucleotide biosynthesis protein B [Dehalococcoidales bacterium]MDD3264833.1 molybdopterin-guanine dinucleotide biosynthesis protein B [Dehalococcoidales bacterium]MDD4322855.1 molybdopterin-guanine dinucleotide biosynthesis protein B [Dehalococcoidales bacterium]MDD4794543.1 molybdopterin-guanine dinucleotide biosynthesis protein B [Dehalococcoidales bacterium]MDD5122291.1 molybdopterin-guanine dinucleotide biosynthesis protein B [Dehalococcoidales bacterium]
MPPIITIVGRSNSGKTTLVEKLTRELTSRGYRIATIKDSHKQPSFDSDGKDSARHMAAGSVATAIRTQQEVVVFHHNCREEEVSLEEISRLLGENADLIIAEGFKYADAAKIEVHRKGRDLLDNPKRLVAIATEEKLNTKARQFDINDANGICDLLEKGFILPNRRRVSLYINNKPIELKAFPRKIIENVIINMVRSLKGTECPESIDISVRKPNDQPDQTLL